MRIVADGTIENGDRFRIDGWPEAFPLSGSDLPDGHTRIRASVRFKGGEPQLTLRNQ